MKFIQEVSTVSDFQSGAAQCKHGNTTLTEFHGIQVPEMIPQRMLNYKFFVPLYIVYNIRKKYISKYNFTV